MNLNLRHTEVTLCICFLVSVVYTKIAVLGLYKGVWKLMVVQGIIV
jgi:hypothetical protein